MSEYEKGDLIIFRDWDDMADEFGYEDESKDSINCRFSFTKRMRHLCGEVATVTRELSGRLYLEFNNKKPGYTYSWNYSTDMVRPYDDAEYDIDEASLINFIMG